MQVVVGYGLERCLAVGLGGAEVVAQLWSRSRRTTTRGSMMMKAWLQVSGWGSAILKARLRGIDDLEEVGAGVARRRVLTTLKAWPQVSGGRTIVGSGPRVSSDGGGAMTAMGRNEGPTKDEKGPIPGRQWWLVG